MKGKVTIPTNVGYENETKEIAAKRDAAVQSKVREGWTPVTAS